jgi:signal transduction histidine kinase
MAVDASIVPARHLSRLEPRRVALSALVIALLLIAVVFVAARLTSPSAGVDVQGFDDQVGGAAVTVDPVSADALSSGLLPGDRVVAVLGRSVETWARLLLDPRAERPIIGPADPITLTVERDGRSIDVTIDTAPFDVGAAAAEDWGVLVLTLTTLAVGVYLFARRPEEPAAHALVIAGTAMFVSTIPWALGLQVTDVVTASHFWLYALTAGLVYTLFWSGILHFALAFPRPYPFLARRGPLVAVVYVLPVLAQAALIVVTALATGSAIAMLGAWQIGQGVLQVAVIGLVVTLMGYSYLRVVDPVSRVQLRWVAAAVIVASLSGLLLWFGPELILGTALIPRSAVALFALPFPIALAIAIDHHHLFDLDRVVNRSLVYGGLTVGVLLTYGATVALLGSLIPGDAPYAVILLGAGAVALAALPIRDRLQVHVDRLMYGDRDDPDRALRRLGQRLEASLDPQTVLPTLVAAVAEATRSPYVAVELEHDGETRVEAAHGSQPRDPGGSREIVRLPIVYRGQSIGMLAVALRAADEPFTRADERLLADLARQAGPAVEAVRLTADLRRSREELISTREEERRRLRRDLHDELGPTLAGSLMKVEAARSLLASEPARAGVLLDDLEADARVMIEEIRRMARDLRPPALDELGLVGALRQRTATFDAGSPEHPMRVSLDAPEELPPLPAAVEVAALRISLEALTNAARHSGATCARVSICMEERALVVSIVDDGVGIAPDLPPGVGLVSMRDRADELGGTLTVGTPDGGGTAIMATLPLTVSGPG